MEKDANISTPEDGLNGHNIQNRGRGSSIRRYHILTVPSGILRWCVSIILLAGAARIIDAGVIPEIRPYAIYNVVCVRTMLQP